MWDGTERRKGQRMPDSFQPQTAFEGYVKANLENINAKFDNLPCKENSQRINDVEKKVSNIEGKTTIFGAVAGFVAGIISKVLMGK